MQWRAIQGYEGYYEVSDSGLVRSLDRIISVARHGYRRIRGKIMKPTVNNEGYMVVHLRRDGTTFVAFIHIKVIQEIMGHADIETTMNIYAEATKEKKKEAFSSLQGKIKIS